MNKQDEEQSSFLPKTLKFVIKTLNACEQEVKDLKNTGNGDYIQKKVRYLTITQSYLFIQLQQLQFHRFQTYININIFQVSDTILLGHCSISVLLKLH